MCFFIKDIRKKINNKDIENSSNLNTDIDRNDSSMDAFNINHKEIYNKNIKSKVLNNKNSKFMKINNLIKLGAFLLIIIIPVLFMNLKSDQVSYIDNRSLMNFEDIFSNKDVFNNIKSYVDDRIGFRTEIVDIYAKVMDKAFNEITHPRYEYGKDGFIMSKAEENEFDPEFMEIYSDFIKDFQKYCNDRGIKFLYTVEPSKETVYKEFLPDGYIYDNRSLDYFLSLLKVKDINYLNNKETLNNAKKNTQVFDIKYDAGHWNETGAIIGISAMLDKLNELDNRVGNFDINRFEKEEYVNNTLPTSYFQINEQTTHYNLYEDNSDYISDFENEIKRDENFRYFTHYKNNKNIDGPRILIFAGSYFNNKEKFITENFSEVMKIHNYRNVIDYEYYINIYNPDIILFESTEYTHKDYYFPLEEMKNKIHIKNIESYNELIQDNLVYIEDNNFSISDNKLTNLSIPISGDDILYAYANIKGRILDCNISEVDNQKYVEFSIMTSEIKDLNEFDLYFISKDEERYQKISCRLG